MTMIEQIMDKLSRLRPVFHSEADFQHSLAWQLHLENSNLKTRLEYPISPEQEKDEDLDILLFDGKREIAIEIKYKTAPFFAPIDGELFLLKNQGAQDQGRYDFLKDVQRLERYLSDKPNSLGYAIFLTNDSSYWRPSRNESTVCDEFRITEGRQISGTLNWGLNAGTGTIKKRETPINLKHIYECKWHEYSNVEKQEFVKGNTQFRHLLFSITSNRGFESTKE